MTTDVTEFSGSSLLEKEYCRGFASRIDGDATRRQAPRSMLERVTVILGCFVNEREQLTLHELVRRTDLPRSTTHRILDSLVNLDWLECSGGRYQLGNRSLRFGSHDRDHIRLRSAANPYLLELHVRTGMTVVLSSIEGSDAVVLDLIGSHRPIGPRFSVGDSVAASQTVAGRAMLAAMTPEAVDELIGGQLPNRAGNAAWTRRKLHCELHRIRRSHGVSVDRAGHSSVHPGVARALTGLCGVAGAVSLHPPTRHNLPDWRFRSNARGCRHGGRRVRRDRCVHRQRRHRQLRTSGRTDRSAMVDNARYRPRVTSKSPFCW